MREATAVIDVGKTRLKLLAIGADAHVLASSSVPARGSANILDVDGAWEWMLAGLRKLTQRFRLTAIVPTTHGAAAALVGEAGLAHPVIDYEAIPPTAIDAAYDALRPPFAETLSPRLPAGLNLGRQLYWIRSASPYAWRQATTLLTYPQYWSWRLTGVRASEVTSLGCHTDLWQPAAGHPSRMMLREGWTKLLPSLRPAWHRLGAPLREHRLPPVIAVCNGIHDSNAAYLRYLAGVPSPFALLSTGTWMVCFNSAGDVAKLDSGRDTLGNVDALGRPIACSRFMGGREYAAIAGPGALKLAPTLADVRTAIGRRIFALPSFSASGGPFPGIAGRITAKPCSPREAAAVATLYIALMSREAIRLTGPVRRLYIDGAFATHRAYTQVLAALLPDVEVHAAEGIDGTAIGASLLAAMAGTGGALPRIAVPARRVIVPSVAIDAYADEWLALAGRALEARA